MAGRNLSIEPEPTVRRNASSSLVSTSLNPVVGPGAESALAPPIPHARRPDWLLAILVVAIAVSHLWPPEVTNRNYRLPWVMSVAWHIARGESVPDTLAYYNRGDDAGLPLLLAGVLKLTYPSERLAGVQPSYVPGSYFRLRIVIDAVAILVLYLAVRSLLNRFVAFGLCLLLVASPAVRSDAFAGDTHFIPIYAGILLLAALGLIRKKRGIADVLLVGCLLGIGACNLCRHGSAIVAFGFLLALIWPHTLSQSVARRAIRLRAAACLAAVAFLVFLPIRLLGKSYHPFWHSLHCGLAEFGGHEDARHNIYPFFVPTEDLPPDAARIEGWTDQREFDLAAQLDPSVERCTPAYEALMRDDFLRIVSEYPAGMAALVARRLWRLVCPNPLQPQDADSGIIASWSDHLWRFGWLAVGASGCAAGMPRRTIFLGLGLAPLMLPPLLVHSGYVMYNLPVHFAMYLMASAAVYALGRRGLYAVAPKLFGETQVAVSA